MNQDVFDYINQHQLVSVMNSTKWRKVEKALNESDEFVPHVRYKQIGNKKPNPGFSSVWWDELLAIAETIEWLDVDPFKRERVGRLVDDRKTDFSIFVSEQLKKHSIPYSIENGMYRVWGYLRPGVSVESL